MSREIRLRRCRPFEEERRADVEFWRRMSGEERAAIVEELGRMYVDQHGLAYGKVERVVRITDLHDNE